MEVGEIIAQGLRGLTGTTRVTLGAAVTAIHPLDGREAAVTAILLDLLYPDTGPRISSFDPAADASRIGLLVKGRDGGTYRILRDLRSGETSLLKEIDGAFQPVSTRPAEIAQTVTAQLGFPQETLLRQVFVTREGDLPSKRFAAHIRSIRGLAQPEPEEATGPALVAPSMSGSGEGRPLPPGFDGMGAEVAMSDDDKRARIAQLKEQLSAAERTQELEFELDGEQKKIFELEEALRPVTALREQLSEAEQALEGMASIELPVDFDAQLAAHERVLNDHNAALDKLDERLDALEASIRAQDTFGSPVEAALKDPLVKFGLAAGVGGILLGIIGAFAYEPLRYAAFLDVPGLAVALVGAWRLIGEREELGALRYRLKEAEKERESRMNKFELDDSAFRGVLRRAGLEGRNVEDIDAVKETARRHREAKEAVEKLRQEFARVSTELNAPAQEQKMAAAQARVRELEDTLSQSGGLTVGQGDVRRELAELEAELRGEPVAPAAEQSGPAAAAPPAQEDPDDVTRELLNQARDLFVTDVPGLASMLAARVEQYVSGLTDQRYTKVEIFGQGEVSVRDASGAMVEFGNLSPGDKDAVWLAIKLTAIEAYVRTVRVPVVLERAFVAFPPTKEQLLARMLQYLGSQTQILLMTEKAGLLPAADRTLQL